MIIFKCPPRYIKRRKSRRVGTAYASRDELLKTLGYLSYAEYLDGPLWKAIREAKLAVDPQCEICDEPASQVHHLSYNRSTLVGKQRHHLVSICDKCHRRVEFRADGSKRNFKSMLRKTREILRKKGRWERHTGRSKPPKTAAWPE